ncbi:DUF5666 domain-containing protein [Mesorhizobium sp. BR1-1-16]|uniref:DUF5666 domain-containing protein n=1 Tax=Mesorhizobium sp. BR1-1-16 TaxID=2876653 RepID=UPI001CCC6B50|nr:DUF5666 domain-containing protein [Mesorhizobium sp. BR1-1-16]MBZ9935102.1 DUF5666 domain-containing protein [Mesorhizobium sp. BR1-1-16]
MSRPLVLSRRGLLLGLAGFVGMRALPGLADETPPSDRGIGGTGISSQTESIGFFGSIQRFGSIFVNGDRIAYADDVAVTIDGRRSRPVDMRIGQVVSAVAHKRDGTLQTDHIDILSEVVGPVEALDGESMIVLGQRVSLGTTGSQDFVLGQRVAVSGLRRPDETIIARLVEPAGGRPDQVVGTGTYRGWTLYIGGLSLFGPDARYDGRRVVVRGNRTLRGLMVRSIALAGLPDGPGVTRLSIEAYVSRNGSELQTGSGFVVNDSSGSVATMAPGQPAILNIDLGSASGGRLGNIRSGAGGGDGGGLTLREGVIGRMQDQSAGQVSQQQMATPDGSTGIGRGVLGLAPGALGDRWRGGGGGPGGP